MHNVMKPFRLRLIIFDLASYLYTLRHSTSKIIDCKKIGDIQDFLFDLSSSYFNSRYIIWTLFSSTFLVGFSSLSL